MREALKDDESDERAEAEESGVSASSQPAAEQSQAAAEQAETSDRREGEGTEEPDPEPDAGANAEEEEDGDTAATVEAEDPSPGVELRITEPAEHARLEAALDAAGFQVVASEDATTVSAIVVSDAPIESNDGAPIETLYIETWAAVVHQRHDVLDLSLGELRAALTGAFPSWVAFGGGPEPLTVLLPDQQAATIRRSLGLPDDAGTTLPLDELTARVESTHGALAVVPLAALRPGLLPLVIDGHDPLRDAAAESPLRLARWLRTPESDTRDLVLLALGWDDVNDTNPLGLIATGDYIPVRCVPDSVRFWADNDFSAVFDLVGGRLHDADVAVVSMEVPVVEERFVTPCLATFVLSAPVAAVDALVGAGVDVLTLAGNHSADCYGGCGRAVAIRNTITTLDQAGLAHAGTGETLAEARRPALIERDGVRIAVLSYEGLADYYFATDTTPGVAPLEEEVLREDIAAALTIVDHVIVAFSHGAEYVTTTLRQQDAAVRIAVDAGASLVIGNHPHAIQPLIESGGSVAAFALGNFVFDQDFSVETTQSLLLEAGFDTERLIGYRVRPVVIRRNYQPEAVDPAGAEGRQILTRLWAATDTWLAR